MQEWYSKLSENQKKFFIVAVCIVLLAAFDRLLLGQVLDNLSMINEKIQSQQNNIQRDARILGFSNRIMETSKKYEKFINKNLADDDVVNAAFLRTIEKLASKTKVSLVKSNPSEITRNTDYIEYFANLDCVGNLDAIISFIYEINSTEDLLKVVSYNMSPKRGDSEEINVSMNILKLVMLPK